MFEKSPIRELQQKAFTHHSFNSSWFNIFIILILGLIIFLPRLDALPFRGEEPRRVISSFEMTQSGNFVVPTIQNQLFLSRPTFQNWVIQATATIRHSYDHLSGRIPSVIFTLLTALLIYCYSVSQLSKPTALMASVFFLTMPQVVQLGLTAETELMFTFLLSGSFLLWHQGHTQGWPSYLKWGVAYFFLAFATLTKGINQAPVYFVLIIGIHLLLKREIKQLFSFGHILGVLIFTLIIGVWQWYFVKAVGFKTGWMMHFGDVGLRFESFTALDYLKHALIFPVELLAMMLPWSILSLSCLTPVFWKNISSSKIRDIAVFLSTAIVVTIWTVWYPAGAKTRYYMPLYPCFAILAAIVFSTVKERLNKSMPHQKSWVELMIKLFRWIGMTAIPLIGLVVFVLYFGGGSNLVLTSSLWHSLIFAMGCCLIGLYMYCANDLSDTRILTTNIIAYGLFVALVVNIVYTDSRLMKLNQVQTSVRQLVTDTLKKSDLFSLNGADFDFLYYYLLETGQTIHLLSQSELAKAPSKTYFCMRSSETMALDDNQWQLITKIPTGRYKQKDSDTGAYMIIGQIM
tara:strand:- start:946 stop:2664 length:1719 start_codon:yes stop_codon:yes gene_type:complete